MQDNLKLPKVSLTSNSSGELVKLASSLFESVVNIHIFHLQTKSYARHMALNSFYDELPDLLDRLVESYQGKYGIVNNYKSVNVVSLEDPISYLTDKVKMCEQCRTCFSDGYIQQIIDDIIELHYSTLYKLKNLN